MVNSTCEYRFNNTHVNVNELTLIGSISIVFAILGFSINSTFILTMVKNKNLRRQLTFVTFLSIGDWIISIFVFTYGLTQITVDLHLANIESRTCFYLRPHLSLFIFGILIQCCALLLVAVQRMVAIVFPIFYYKRENSRLWLITCLTVCAATVIVYISAVIVGVVKYHENITCSNLCWPTNVINESFGKFLYGISASFGVIAVAMYVIVFLCKFVEMKFSFRQNLTEHDDHQMKRERWILKICCIMTFSAFACIILPHCILAAAVGTKEPTSAAFILRKYVGFMLGTNSFIGLTVAMIASRELRGAVRELFPCCKIGGTRHNESTDSNRSNATGRFSITQIEIIDQLPRGSKFELRL